MPTSADTKTATTRSRKSPPAPVEFARTAPHPLPSTPEPAAEVPAETDHPHPKRPTHHKGVAVRREELLYNLPNKAPFKITRLHLADDKQAYACRDCLFTDDSRGKVMEHRNQAHGSKYGRKNAMRVAPDMRTPDPVLPPRSDGTPAPSDPMEMTLRELLALMPSLAALGDLVARVEDERDALAEEVAEYRNNFRNDQHKIDVYPALRSEVIELRAWKKKTVKKFEDLGFKLQEEEE